MENISLFKDFKKLQWNVIKKLVKNQVYNIYYKNFCISDKKKRTGLYKFFYSVHYNNG